LEWPKDFYGVTLVKVLAAYQHHQSLHCTRLLLWWCSKKARLLILWAGQYVMGYIFLQPPFFLADAVPPFPFWCNLLNLYSVPKRDKLQSKSCRSQCDYNDIVTYAQWLVIHLIFTLPYFNSQVIVKVISNRLQLYVLIQNPVVCHFKLAAIIGSHSRMVWHPRQFSLPLSKRFDQEFLIRLLCI